MRLRPIDAIFVHPKRRLYVVYYRGELWELPRMKIDDKSWQNRKLYTDDSRELYLSIHQAISDPVLAQKLRTLNLPAAVRGSNLPRYSPAAVSIDDSTNHKSPVQKDIPVVEEATDIFAEMLADLASEVLNQHD